MSIKISKTAEMIGLHFQQKSHCRREGCRAICWVGKVNWPQKMKYPSFFGQSKCSIWPTISYGWEIGNTSVSSKILKTAEASFSLLTIKIRLKGNNDVTTSHSCRRAPHVQIHPFLIIKLFLVAKLLCNSECPLVVNWGKCDFLGSYSR